MPALALNLNELWADVQTVWEGPQEWWQWGWVAGGLIVAFLLSRLIARTIFAEGSKCRGACERFFNPTRRIGAFPMSAAMILWLIFLCAQPAFNDGARIVFAAALIATAYAIYRLASSLSKGRTVPRLLGIVLLVVIVLVLMGSLDSVLTKLRGFNLPLGDLQLNLWAIASGIAALFFLLWLANLSSRFVDFGLSQQAAVPPSMRVLMGKIARFVFYLAAILVSLKIGGFNLGALAVFSGALGLGIGFGLQKVISNLVSGVIILLDKSIKPGDVIEIDNAYGSINSLRTRYVSVITRDRKEYPIPNEDFITSPVINWSFSGKEIRIRADVGVAYGTDLRKAIELGIEAAAAEERVLKQPAPNCLLRGFGDSAIDLQIRFWIRDAQNGVSNVKSAVLLGVWDRFQEHGIEIPFPQRDLHVKEMPGRGLSEDSGYSR